MKVQINIRGRRYSVRSDQDGEDLQALAAYVDAKMTEISSKSTTMDEYTIAMLAALNIASEFDRFRRGVDDELAAIDRELASTAVILESMAPAGANE